MAETDIELGTLGAVIHSITEPFAESKDSVKSRALSAPPAASEGHRYIVGSSPTGAWAGHAGQVTRYDGANWMFFVPSEGTSAWVDDEDRQVTFDGAVWVTTSGAGAISTPLNKRMTAAVTVNDGDQACNTALAAKPAAGCHVALRVNGVGVDVGNGSTSASCYFTAPGQTSARAWSQLQVGDVLRWNGSLAGFELDGGDVLDLDYEVEG